MSSIALCWGKRAEHDEAGMLEVEAQIARIIREKMDFEGEPSVKSEFHPEIDDGVILTIVAPKTRHNEDFKRKVIWDWTFESREPWTLKIELQ
jgi:hypothetical protein